MQKDYNENDAEKRIFREKLDSLQIEPSEKFWNAALHSIIDKERAQSKRTVRKWKFIAYSLGIVVLFFCIHEVWMGGRMSDIEKQVTEIKGEQKHLMQKDNTAPTVVAKSSTNHTTGTRSNVNGESHQPVAASDNSLVSTDNKAPSHSVKQTDVSAEGNNIVVKSSVAKANPVHVLAYNKASESKPVASARSVKGAAAWQANDNNKVAASHTNNEQQPADTKVASGGNNGGDNTGNESTVPANVPNAGQPVDNSKNTPAVASANQPESSQQGANGVKQQSANAVAAGASSSCDSVNNLSLPKPAADKVAFTKRLSFSAFFTPGMVNDFMKCKDYDNDNDNDRVSTGELKSRQSKWFGYQTGINIGVDLSSHFKLSTGVYYSRYSYDIKETLLKAELQENGDVGCTLVTSSGVVYVPYETTTPLRVGDSLKVHGSSARDYICIPLRFYWNILSHNKLGFYAAGGLDANMAAHSSTSLHWENTYLQEGQVTVQSTEGLSAIHYAYNFGLGLTYLLGKGISIYGEPHMQGSLTSINKNTPVVTYPYFFGCEVGLTWHL